jgi:hypothetical protein
MPNTLFQWIQPGKLRTMQADGREPAGQQCQDGPELILAGSGITGPTGEWTLNVRPALCLPSNIVDWVSLVATPSLPYVWNDNGVPPFPPLQAEYVTTAWLWSTSGGLILFVNSWGPNGQAKPGVEFSWHATVIQH